MTGTKLQKVLAPGDNPQDDQPPQDVNVTENTDDTREDTREDTGGDTRDVRPRRSSWPVGALTPRPEYLAFAGVLREAMLRHKLSASAVARHIWGDAIDKRGYKVAKNRDRIGHYLAGVSYPEPENLKLLAEAIGVPVGELAIESRPRPLPREPRGVVQTTSLQLTATNEPGKAHLQLNRVLEWETALRILQMIKEDERKAMTVQMPSSGRSFGKPDPELRDPARAAEVM